MPLTDGPQTAGKVSFKRMKDLMNPIKEEKVKLGLDVPLSMYQGMATLAIERQCSLSSVVRAAVRKYLEENK